MADDGTTISQNQYDYLNNLASQGGGNAEWAKSQLDGVTVEKPPTTTPTTTTQNTGYNNVNNNYSSGGNAFNGFNSGSSSSSSGNSQTAPTAQTAPTHPSWMGSQYGQDANGYWSTNPSNPNAERFRSDGSPVASVSYDDYVKNQHFNGYANPDQWQQLMNSSNNPAAESGLLDQWLKAGQLQQPAQTPQANNNPMLASTTSPGTGTFTPSKVLPGYGAPDVNDPTFLNKSPQERLAAFTGNPTLAQQELNRVKGIYSQTTDPNQQQNIHNWADQVRQAAGISANDPFFGNGNNLQSQGQANLNVDGQSKSNVNIYNGTSYDDAAHLAQSLGLSFSRDQNGKPVIGGKTIDSYYKDSAGNLQVPTQLVGNMLGLKVGWDPKSGTVNITGSNQSNPNIPVQPASGAPGTVQPGADQFGIGGNQPANGLSGNNQMPIQQQFNPDWTSYYQQAHNQIDPLYNTQYNALMSKQAGDISGMDQKMNARGIFTSGIAQAAEDDLRAKTTNSVASLFNKQMSDIEKTAQTLYTQAYKEHSDGNNFALKYNQDQITNYMNNQKQVFSQWLQTQKLDLSQQQYALNAWDKMANYQLNQMKAMLPYEQQTANNAANNATSAANNANNNATSMEKALLPYHSMTVYQQATTQEKAQMDAAINYFKQQGINIDTAKLIESIRHNQASESLAGQRMTVSIANNQANFAEKVRMDNQNIDKASAQALNASKQTQLSGMKDELNTIASRMNSYVSQGQQVPQTLVDNYNTIKNSIEKVITPNGSTFSGDIGTSDGSFDANNQF